jgi:ribonuclease T1
MRNRTSGSKWLAVAAMALLAAFAWTTLRAPNDTAPGAPVVAPTRDARAPRPLEVPPPVGDNASATTAHYPDFLPREAIETMQLIERGGPYPHRQDDGVFGNREGRLPRQSRGYYREYTVETPGSRDRGARRIIAGGRPQSEFFYTDDHYRSFRRFTLDDSASDSRESPR